MRRGGAADDRRCIAPYMPLASMLAARRVEVGNGKGAVPQARLRIRRFGVRPFAHASESVLRYMVRPMKMHAVGRGLAQKLLSVTFSRSPTVARTMGPGTVPP